MFRHIVPLMMLVCTPALLLAEEAPAVIPSSAPEGAPEWVAWIWPILFAVVIPYLVGFLREKKDAANAEAEKIQLDASKSLMEQKNLLIDKRVIPYLWSTAQHIAERDLPKILADAMDGDGKFDWKGHAKSMGAELLESVKDKFAQEGIDIVKVLGEKYLGQLIDRAIKKAIPWLPDGIESTVANVAEGRGAQLAGLIINYGLEFANKRWLNGRLGTSED